MRFHEATQTFSPFSRSTSTAWPERTASSFSSSLYRLSLPQVYVTSSRSHRFQWATVHTMAPLLPHFLAFCSCGAGMGVRQYWGTCWCHWHPQDTESFSTQASARDLWRGPHTYSSLRNPLAQKQEASHPHETRYFS